MSQLSIFPAGSTRACQYAGDYLRSLGLPVTDSPGDHPRYLLLDAPAFCPDGMLRDGRDAAKLLETLPRDILIAGGNLNNPQLDGYEAVDFLKDEAYLCENAYITAECALDVALPYLSRTIRGLSCADPGLGTDWEMPGTTVKSHGCRCYHCRT